MSTKPNSTTKPNSFKTNITDTSGQVLAEWFSLNERTEADRREVAADLGAIITSFCTACQLGEHCGGCVCCS